MFTNIYIFLLKQYFSILNPTYFPFLIIAVRPASADGSLTEQHQLEQLLEHGLPERNAEHQPEQHDEHQHEHGSQRHGTESKPAGRRAVVQDKSLHTRTAAGHNRQGSS